MDRWPAIGCQNLSRVRLSIWEGTGCRNPSKDISTKPKPSMGCGSLCLVRWVPMQESIQYNRAAQLEVQEPKYNWHRQLNMSRVKRTSMQGGTWSVESEPNKDEEGVPRGRQPDTGCQNQSRVGRKHASLVGRMLEPKRDEESSWGWRAGTGRQSQVRNIPTPKGDLALEFRVQVWGERFLHSEATWCWCQSEAG